MATERLRVVRGTDNLDTLKQQELGSRGAEREARRLAERAVWSEWREVATIIAPLE